MTEPHTSSSLLLSILNHYITLVAYDSKAFKFLQSEPYIPILTQSNTSPEARWLSDRLYASEARGARRKGSASLGRTDSLLAERVC